MKIAKPDKKNQIMSAAEKLFHSGRFHEITLEDVAREAKVGKGTIYLYFPDKTELFFQTATNGFEELCSLLANKPENISFAEELEWACAKVQDFFNTRRQLFRMMEDEELRVCISRGNLRERWQQKRRGLVKTLAVILEDGANKGEIRKDFAPEVLSDFLLGMMRTWARDLDFTPPARSGEKAVLELFVNGAGLGSSPKY